jgi:hypothetical protein
MLDLNGAIWLFTNYLPVMVIVLTPTFLLWNRTRSTMWAMVGANAGVVLGFWFGPAVVTLQIVILTFLLDVLLIYPKIKQYIPGG